MAAEIHSRPQSSRPALLSKIEGHQDAVSAALLIPKEDGVITAGEDRWRCRGDRGSSAARGARAPQHGPPGAAGAASLLPSGRPGKGREGEPGRGRGRHARRVAPTR